jgi:CDGSH-type Zn-finger protein
LRDESHRSTCSSFRVERGILLRFRSGDGGIPRHVACLGMTFFCFTAGGSACAAYVSCAQNARRLKSAPLDRALPGCMQKGAGMSSTKITVRNDGPFRVEGEIELVDAEGRPYGLGGRTTITLCRCGHSANKPLCDGSHRAAGFQDKQQARELPPPKPRA